MKRRTVLALIGEQRRQAVLWLLLSADIGFFAPLKSFILQWIIDSKSGEDGACRHERLRQIDAG